MGEHVIYSHDPGWDPAWGYRSFPIAAIGMADTLEQSRASFSEALDLALDEGESAPAVIEHLERRHPAGFWYRIQLGAGASERDYAAQIFLNTWVNSVEKADTPPSMIARTRTDIGEPIVIACLPTDTIGSVVDQLGTGESVAILLSMVNIEEGYEATWVSGISRGAQPDPGRPSMSLPDQGLSLNSTIEQLMQRSIELRQSNTEPLLVVA